MSKLRATLLVGGIAAILLVAFCQARGEEDAESIRTRADLDTVIARLGDKTTRLDALEQLLTFAGNYYYHRGGSMRVSTGDAEQDALMEHASDAISGCRDFETISQALRAPGSTLQCWGLTKVPESPFDAEDSWETLVPQVRRLATCEREEVRAAAIDWLEDIDGQRDFLKQCLESETSLRIIMRMLYRFDNRGYKQQIGSYVIAMLNHDDPEVRKGSLLFIGGNSNNAEMWQFEFSDAVLARVLELSHSQSDMERSVAVYALVDLRRAYRGAVRKRILELGDDPCDDVRWRLPGALREQKDRSDVQAFLARLLQDRSPIVQYFTILELGPEKHLAQLEKLAAGDDRKVAKFAADKLKQLEAADR